VQVDFARLRENAAWWRRLVSRADDTSQRSEPDTKLCAVVKADGYGVGASTIARAALAGGAEMLAVFSSEQARSLLTYGFTQPILILGPGQLLDVASPMSSAAVSRQLHFTLHDEGQASAINDAAMALRCVVSVHLQIDTGMTRGGFTQAQAMTFLDSLEHYPGIRVVGLSTHLATADGDPDFAAEQLSRFDLTSKNLGDSAAGSIDIGRFRIFRFRT
jgi:alanine racemase